jgi:hypothetical protein
MGRSVPDTVGKAVLSMDGVDCRLTSNLVDRRHDDATDVGECQNR